MSFFALILLGLSALGADAQTPSAKVATTTSTVTISVTSTFQQALASSARNGCTLQYMGSNTGYVYFGLLANATTSNSFQLTSKQSINCQWGGIVLTDAVNVSGTANDVWVITAQ